MRECDYCGKPFIEKDGHEIFCSEECRYQQRLLKRRIKRKEKIDARGYKPRRSHLEWTGEDVQNRINTKSSKIIYIGGYTNCESPIYVYCDDCGQPFQYSAANLRKQRPIQCDNCRHILSKINETNKRNEVQERKRIKQEEYEKILIERLNNKKRVCKNCGELFVSSKSNYNYCSTQCRKRYENRISYLRKRIKRNTNFRDSGITIENLIKKDGNKCWLCKKPVDMTDYIVREDGTFIAGKNYPSIDHVNALANGGTHTWDNVRLAHCECNRRKRDNLFFEDRKGQLKLFF